MSEFNPYNKWFGIPDDNKSPNHYQLLGVTYLEEDPDVIEAAAEQRLLFLRSIQNGPNGALAQKMSNEVMSARTLLLNPDRKASYDRFIGSFQSNDDTSQQDTNQPSPAGQTATNQPTAANSNSPNYSKPQDPTPAKSQIQKQS